MQVSFLNLNTLGTAEKSSSLVAEDLRKYGDLISAVVKWVLANRRGFSTAKTKQISEISATGKKPFRQKHRGAARQGSLVAAQFVGGAKSFGPRPRDYSYTIPKKMVKKALLLVLKDKIANKKFYVLEELDKLPISTNSLGKKFTQLGINDALVVCKSDFDTFIKSVRNIKNVKLIGGGALNVYDMLNYDFLLLDKDSYQDIMARITGEVKNG